MSRILMLYGTTDGQTRKIADWLAEVLGEEGARADVIDAARAGTTVRPGDYDGVVVAASVHLGSYQRAVRAWVRRHAEALNRRPSAFLSVCLAVLEPEPEPQREVRAILDRFLVRTGWRPAETRLVAGALPYTRYGWFKKWMMKRIVRKTGDTDTTRDYEYTDWDDLRAFARAFVARLAAPQPAGGKS